MNRQGSLRLPPTLAIATSPVSSGARNASSTSRRNSQSSSRKSSPRWARVISPGRGGVPPPIRPAALIVWWGARNGRPAGRPAPSRPVALAIRATSSASASPSGGRIEGSRLAASDFPAPGGPTISSEWPPAAATSSAWRRCGCPRRSARSGAPGAGPVHSRRGNGAGARSPAARAGSPATLPNGTTSTPPASAASGPFAAGTTTASAPSSRAASAIASTPWIGRTWPSSATSPANATRSIAAHRSWPEALRSAAAIARSIPGPALRRAAGARFTTIRCNGNSKPQLTRAARTRSRASRTAASGRPTIAKPGSPRWTSTSTDTGRAEMPSRVKVLAVASTTTTLGGKFACVARST